MKAKDKYLHKINTISEFHKLRGLPKPAHPLVSVIDYSQVKNLPQNNNVRWVLNFYVIGLKRDLDSYLNYGQQVYDFDEGVMTFMAPGQVLNVVVNKNSTSIPTGMILLIHPDFLWNSPLAKKIKQYEFFGYATNEALFLSEKEEHIIGGVLQNIEQEYHANIDGFSQQIILAQLEVLLNYADRFYRRQFITRKITNHHLLDRLEEFLTVYFDKEDIATDGLPTVQSVADALNVSPDYLTSMLKVLTGQTTQQHIHEKLISKAKEKLSVTNLSVSEIAYELGFEHPQSFSKLFKSKTDSSPIEFRRSFN